MSKICNVTFSISFGQLIWSEKAVASSAGLGKHNGEATVAVSVLRTMNEVLAELELLNMFHAFNSKV